MGPKEKYLYAKFQLDRTKTPLIAQEGFKIVATHRDRLEIDCQLKIYCVDDIRFTHVASGRIHKKNLIHADTNE